MKQWKRSGKLIRHDETVIYYENGGQYTIESRKRKIPHANGYSGTWDHTSYFVVQDGQDLKECSTLKDAKAYAEELERKEVNE